MALPHLKAYHAEQKDRNRKAIVDFYASHIGCTRADCAEVLGINVMTISGHLNEIKAEWKGKPCPGCANGRYVIRDGKLYDCPECRPHKQPVAS